MSSQPTDPVNSIDDYQLDELLNKKCEYDDILKEKTKELGAQQVHIAELDPGTQDYNKNLDAANTKIVC